MISKIRQEERSVLLLTSLILSVFLINIFIRRGFDFEYLKLSIYDIEQSLNLNIVSLIFYVFLKRGKQFIVIWLLMKVIKPDLVYNIILIVLCGMYGVMSTVQSYYIGFQGIITFIIYMLPHYIIYIFMIKLLHDYYAGYRQSKNVMSDAGAMDEIMSEKAKVTALFIILFAMGVISEGFFSRFFLLQYYQYMVL
ncbi:MAG: stage II sporulation protein M [Lachnospiraceae bacterium]|nr:stage II sporulation protein M [Lachnospiraceae bacterium]